MARGKRAVALFEVIQSAKKKQPNKAVDLSTPSWWFKRRPKADAGQSDSPSAAPIAPIEQVHLPVMREVPMIEPADDQPLMPVEIVAPPPAIRPAPRVGVLDEAVSMQRDVIDHEEFGAPPTDLPALRVGVDRNRQVFRLQVTYGSAMVTAVGLLVVVILAFIIGKAISRGPASASASPSIEDLRKGAVFGDVLKDPDSVTKANANLSDPPTPRAIQLNATGKTNTSPSTAQPQGNQSQGPVAVPDAKRIVGMQYVLVQSYPDEDDAVKAIDLLKKNGINCTMEKDLPGWGSNWFCVVGSTGFERTKNNPQFDQYVKAIRDVGAQFANSSKFKKFEPKPIGWRPRAQG